MNNESTMQLIAALREQPAKLIPKSKICGRLKDQRSSLKFDLKARCKSRAFCLHKRYCGVSKYGEHELL